MPPRVAKPIERVVEVDTSQHLNWPSAFKRDLEDMLSRRIPPHMIIKHAFSKYALVLYRYDISHYRTLFKQRLAERDYKPHYKDPKPVITLKVVNLPEEPQSAPSPYRWTPPREERPTLLTAQSDQCRWIDDELPVGERHNSRCCGKKVHRQSYCKAHAKIAFPPLTPEQRRAILRQAAKPPKDGY